MNKASFPTTRVAPLCLLGTCLLSGFACTASDLDLQSLAVAHDSTGAVATYSVKGRIDKHDIFFQALGTNGRSCSTCHVAEEAMSFTSAHARQLYEQTRGADPLFASVDGANCATVARGDRAGHSLMVNNGLVRIATAVPTNAEFSISVVHDPYGCALRVDPKTSLLIVSVYRRPLPTANLSFLSAVMFDGRETLAPLTSAITLNGNLRADLTHQALDATMTHAEAGAAPTDAQLSAIVDFELSMYTAQLWDRRPGLLSEDGAKGGPVDLAGQTYYPGINDTLGGDPRLIAFTPVSMTLYSAWDRPVGAPADDSDEDRASARAEIAAGERLFDSAPMTISNVRGLNDNAALSKPTTFAGTCATCHDTPNVGHHSLPLPLDIGTSHASEASYEPDSNVAAAVSELSMPDLPIFLISGCANPFTAGQAESFYTTDPGRALITGHCADFNRVKGPILRGLAARPPYFHNGAAADLHELINFYNQRFNMSLTAIQKNQLVAFLNTL